MVKKKPSKVDQPQFLKLDNRRVESLAAEVELADVSIENLPSH